MIIQLFSSISVNSGFYNIRLISDNARVSKKVDKTDRPFLYPWNDFVREMPELYLCVGAK